MKTTIAAFNKAIIRLQAEELELKRAIIELKEMGGEELLLAELRYHVDDVKFRIKHLRATIQAMKSK